MNQNESALSKIKIIKASEHNLKDVSVDIPKNALVVITGPSGSGKSSLALDVLYAEGRRRYVESLSSYARQFLGNLSKPNVEAIHGLCPSIAIEQKTISSNARSTVGTITEIYDYLRVLFARIGVAHCYKCNAEIKAHSAAELATTIIEHEKGKTISILAPIVKNKRGEFLKLVTEQFQKGFNRMRINGVMYKFKSEKDLALLPPFKKTFFHSIDLCLDYLEVTPEESPRIIDGITKAFSLSKGQCTIINAEKNTEKTYAAARICITCDVSIPEIEPRLFSFNAPLGACGNCMGTGIVNSYQYEAQYRIGGNIKRDACWACQGKRLNHLARSVRINQVSITDLCALSIEELAHFFENIHLSEFQKAVVGSLLSEIKKRISFLTNIGLSYLTLDRPADTLSGGEGQRIRLATQLGSALSGVLYVLDEPSIGLHQRDNDRLIQTLITLKNAGNTVLVVEHDIDTVLAADHVIDMGPGAGKLGGTVTATGTAKELAKQKNSLTGSFLSGARKIDVPKERRKPQGWIELSGITKHNIKNLTVTFPKKILCGVSGISGSGKSTLVMDVFAETMKNRLDQRQFQDGFRNMVVIDQSPIGRTPRSNSATYLGIFNDIRKLFASIAESNARGYTQSEFSFNTGNGRCEKCSGDGSLRIEMHFLPSVDVQCDECHGKRYTRELLEIKYKGLSVADVLALSAREAVVFFAHHESIRKRIQLMCDVGLDYITLGQSATTFSGGEAQRIKLVNELAKRGSDTLYILDEPTTGLHISDIEKLLYVLNRLVDKGNTMVVIEHNLDVLKCVDYIIDMGPEAGNKGGQIIAAGTPEEVCKITESHTGRYLKSYLLESK
jgi:excinuclease ABC subunit A